MFELFRAFLEPIFQVVPRISRRPSVTEFCVVDGVLGVRITRLPQVYMEILTHVEFYPRAPQPLDLEIQTLLTQDGVEVTLNATISAVVVDPVSVRITLGQEECLHNLSIAIRSSLAELVTSMELSEFQDKVANGDVEKLVAAKVAAVSRHSMELVTFAIEDFALTESRRHYGLSQQTAILG